MRFGVFGGTFNPIHFGHLRAAEEARQRVGLERVLFVPSATPPLKSEYLADIEHRYRMTAMAVAANRFFGITDMECRRPERSYTVETARTLRDEYAGADIFFILGVDAFMELPMWREPEELIKLIDFIIIGRPTMRFSDLSDSPFVDVPPEELEGLDSGTSEMLTTKLKRGRSAVLLGTPLLDISSTAIREHIREEKSIKYLLPEKVESFIMTHGLYKGKK
jgi:nicotinate-nucleotide adenylyltransferase